MDIVVRDGSSRWHQSNHSRNFYIYFIYRGGAIADRDWENEFNERAKICGEIFLKIEQNGEEQNFVHFNLSINTLKCPTNILNFMQALSLHYTFIRAA